MKTLLKTFAIFCLGTFALVGCAQPDDDTKGNSKKLILVADKYDIYDNGEDAATLTIYHEGEILTEGYVIYDGEFPIEGNKFTSTEIGTHKLWASYGTLISDEISINVTKTPPPAPAAPEDANPDKTNFVRRVLLTQFTGTGCGYCPYMINALYLVSTNEELANKVVLSAAHLFNENDPAYLSDAKTLDNAMSINTFPNLVVDLNKNTRGIEPMFDNIKDAVNTAFARTTVKGGIAVNSEYHEDSGFIVLSATVKAKSTGEFRIGAWLLEDGINANQGNNGISPTEGVNFNIHNNCIRIANSKQTNSDFSGFSLGTIEAGKTASHEFVFKLKDNGNGGARYWNHDNLRVIVFISTKEGSNWYVNNVVKCPKHGSVDFEYED